MKNTRRLITDDDEFCAYRDNLLYTAEAVMGFSEEGSEAAFQGAMIGMISAERDRVFTAEQTAKLIAAVLEHKMSAPHMRPKPLGRSGKRINIITD